jgi:hypothetical protein
MKRFFLLALICVFVGMAAETMVFALEKAEVPSAQASTQVSSGPAWLAGEMPLNTWLGISESERMKIARGFADDYYAMDKGCRYAKIKAYYDEKKGRAYLYVECQERSGTKSLEKTDHHVGT